MILRAKTLGNPVAMIRYRMAVFIVVCVLTPIYAVLTFVEVFVPWSTLDRDIRELITYGISASQLLFLLIILCGTTYHIISSLIWSSKNKALKKKVFRRTALLLGSNIALFGMLFSVIFSIIDFPHQTPFENFCTNFCLLLTSIASGNIVSY